MDSCVHRVVDKPDLKLMGPVKKKTAKEKILPEIGPGGREMMEC